MILGRTSGRWVLVTRMLLKRRGQIRCCFSNPIHGSCPHRIKLGESCFRKCKNIQKRTPRPPRYYCPEHARQLFPEPVMRMESALKK